MYSARIDGEPTTFGTSGLLYKSNKLMYDRTTNTIWHQFTGEPVIGPLAEGGIKLPFLPVTLTTWDEWSGAHPDTTVISIETGTYPASFYVPESDPDAIYYDYFNSTDTMFPVWQREGRLETKDVVLGLGIEGEFKAYPVPANPGHRIVNDTVGARQIVVVRATSSQAARVYERNGQVFSTADAAASARDGLPASMVDSDGSIWRVTQDYLVSEDDPSRRLERIATHMAFWFGWFAFHPETEVYQPRLE